MPLRTSLVAVVVAAALKLSECTPNPGPLLTSSLEAEGRTSACLGEWVVFTCSVEMSGILQWAVESYHTIGGDPIVFTIDDDIGHTVDGGSGQFSATLTSKMPHNVYWGNLSSNLTVLADRVLQNKMIHCSDGFLDEAQSPHLLLTIGGPPSAPLSLLHTIEAYSGANYSVIVQWEAPNDIGGIGISNYTTTLNTVHKEHIYTEQRSYLHLILSYNQVYSFHVVASNCMGTGPPVYLTDVYSVSCGIPEMYSARNHGTEQGATISTQEGSTVKVQCRNEEEAISIQCQENGTWIPDPSQLNCSESQPSIRSPVYCQSPGVSASMDVVVGSTAVGSTATYQCTDGYEPSDMRVTVCTAVGEWVPDPATLECTKPVDCGHPSPPVNGTVHYTGTGRDSKAVVMCNAGLTLFGIALAVCSDGGVWEPNPVDQQCMEYSTTEQCTSEMRGEDVYVYSALLAAALLIVASLLGAIIVGALIHSGYKRHQGKKESCDSAPLSGYEEVRLDHDAEQTMNLRSNEAYEVHTPRYNIASSQL